MTGIVGRYGRWLKGRLGVLCLCVLALAGCRTVAEGLGLDSEVAGNRPDGFQRMLLGRAATGGECLLEARPSSQVVAVNNRFFGIICARWQQDAAEVTLLEGFSSDSTPEQIGEQLVNFSRTSRWAQAAFIRLECQPPSRTANPPEGFVVFGTQCEKRRGGWKVHLYAIRYGSSVVLVEGRSALLDLIYRSGRLLHDPQMAAEAAGKTTNFEAIRLRRLASVDTEQEEGGEVDAELRYTNLTRLGQLYNGTGANDRAETIYREAEELHRRYFEGSNISSSDVQLNIFMETSNQGRFVEAENLRERLEESISEGVNPADKARLRTYLAQHRANQGRANDALIEARQAEILWQNLLDATISGSRQVSQGDAADIEANTFEFAEVMNARFIQAFMQFRLGNLDEARELLENVQLGIAKSNVAPKAWVARINGLAARIARARGNLPEAIRLAQREIETRQEIFGRGRFLALANGTLAETYQEAGNEALALQHYRTMLEIVGEEGIGSYASLISFERLQPYMNLLALRTVAAETSEARQAAYREMFTAMQYIRQGVSSEVVARATTRPEAGSGDELARLLRSIRRAGALAEELRLRYRFEQSKPDKQRNPGYEADLLKLRLEAEKEAESLDVQLRSSFPDAAGQIDQHALSLEEVQQALQPDEAMLIYLMGKNSGFVFLVKPTEVFVEATKFGDEILREEVLELRRPFEEAAVSERISEFDMKLSHRLYRRLIGPVRERLAGVRQLAISHSGALGSLPFSTLIASTPPDRVDDYSNADWLTRHFATYYVPSVRSFTQNRKAADRELPADTNRQQEADRRRLRFLALAAPNYSGDRRGLGAVHELAGRCRTGDAVPRELIEALAPLPGTREEVELVEQYLQPDDSRILVGDEASEANLRKEDLEQYQVLYFATHGLLPGELVQCQSEPGLALSPPPRTAQAASADGILDASEIVKLNLKADLVVLSACNTGGGGSGDLGGDAVAGLARAFFVAGARNLLVTHWVLPDKSAKILSPAIFREVQTKDASMAQAMQTARLQLVGDSDLKHPVFWAPLVLVGDGSLRLRGGGGALAGNHHRTDQQAAARQPSPAS